MKRTLLALALSTLFAAPALAQAPKKKEPAPKPTRTLTIEAEEVNGDRVTGQLGPISIKQAATSSSLIRIRRDFSDLILKSAEET